MTREEAVDIIKCLAWHTRPNEEDIEMAIKALEQEPCDKYIKEIDHLRKYIYKLETQIVEQEPRWIPVSERLPDTDDEFLCWYEYYHWSQRKVLPGYGLGRYLREISSWSGEVASGRDVRVIAWMPLPKPYKAESEDK